MEENNGNKWLGKNSCDYALKCAQNTPRTDQEETRIDQVI